MMSLDAIIPVYLVFIKILLILTGAIFLLSGLDDLTIDLYHMTRSLYRRLFVMPKYQPLTENQLLLLGEQAVAIMIPAWDESSVIGRMLENTLQTLNYSNYHIFVGTYPNDTATQRVVETVRERFEIVHRIVCPKDGPTNKADCLNWIYQGISHFEKAHGIHFEIFVIQDSEDIIHPLSLKLFNYLIPRKDMVQLPVFPLEDKWHHFTSGHYMDEFAENHSKDLAVREFLGRSIPSAGVGCAFSRRALDLVAGDNRNQLFNIDSLTEDYDFGFRLREYNLKQIFVKYAVDRTIPQRRFRTSGSRQVRVKEYVATREHFPATCRAAVRQKSRWIVGITLQGWTNLGWRGDSRTKYMLFRDRKALITNQVNMLGYVIVVTVLTLWATNRLMPDSYHYPPLVETGSWLWYTILMNSGFLVLRLSQRAFYVHRIYGWRQALLSLPRQTWGNVINFLAVSRAFYLFGCYLATGKLIAWDKTDHVFPSEAELTTYRRQLGDLFLEKRFITIAQLDEALARQKEVNRPLGAILIEMGLVREEDVVQILGLQLQMSTREIDPYDTPLELLELLPRRLAVQYSIVPVAMQPGGRLVVAANNLLRPEQVEQIEQALNRPIEICLATRSDVAFAIRRGYERLEQSEDEASRSSRLGQLLLKRRLITEEQLREALKVQRRGYARLGDVLTEEGMISPEMLQDAVRQYALTSRGRFGDFLVQNNYINLEQLERALQLQRARHRRLGDVLLELRMISGDTLEQLLRESPRTSNPLGRHIVWFLLVASILTMGLLLSETAAAREQADLNVTRYLGQLQVRREETWLRRIIREFRTYPHLDRAYRLMEDGRLAEARTELEQYLTIDPRDLQVRTTYLILLHRMKAYAEVIREADRILHDSPRFVPALLYRGMAYQSLDRLDEASKDFAATSAVSDIEAADRIFALNATADIAIRRQRYSDALSALEKLTETAKDFSLRLRQGIALEGLHRLAEADTAYRHALVLARNAGDRLSAYRAIGEVANKRRDWEGAQRAFLSALTLEPDNPELMRALGEVAYARKDYPDAIRWIRRALALRPNRHDQELLAYAMERQGRTAEAIAVYQQLLKGLPQRSDAAQDLLARIANLEVTQGNPAKSATLFVEAFERGGASNWTLLAQAAQSLALAERWEEAARVNRRLLELKGVSMAGKAEALENLGFVYIRLNQYPSAVDAFRKAISAGRDGWHIRQNLGLTLYKMKRWNEALEHFSIALQRKRSPLSLAYVGRTYKELNKPGVAIHYMRAALAESDADQLDKTGRRDLYNGLGYLYADEGQYARAAEVWTRSLVLQDDPVIALRLGKMQRLLNRIDEARKTLEGIDPAALPPQLRIERFEELASIYRQQGRFEEAIDALTSAHTIQAAAHRHYLLGLNYRSAKRPDEAIAHFREAGVGDPNNTLYATALGYAYKDIDRFGETARLFEAVIERDPDHLPLYKDLGYLHMREINNDRAERWFRLAIDNEPLYPTHSLEEEEELRRDIYRMRKEIAKLTNRYDFTAYLSYTSMKRRQTVGPGLVDGGAIASQAGVQFAYQPPVLGFRDERIFQLFARILWNIQPRSLDFDEESYQGGLGIRYKPLRTHNLYVSAERLYKIGDRSENNWLLRTLYSWDYGYDLRPGEPRWNYTFLFGDLAYFVKNPRTTYYLEARQGITFNVRNTLLVTPHLILDGRYQDPHRMGSSYFEGGIGLSLKYLFNETRYEAHRSSFELLMHYKKGSFLTHGLSVGGDSFDGVIVMGVLQF